MELKHLKHKLCPSCGARVMVEKQRNKHCNGQWNEMQMFECGCTIEYSPNFNKESTSQACPNTPEEKKKKDKRDVFRTKLKSFIKKADVDDDHKERLFSRIDYI